MQIAEQLECNKPFFHLTHFLGEIFSFSWTISVFNAYFPPKYSLFSLKKRIYEEIVGENDGRKLFMELAQVAASAERALSHDE